MRDLGFDDEYAYDIDDYEDYGVNYECHVETCKFCYPDPACFVCGDTGHSSSVHDKVTDWPYSPELDFRPVEVELWAARDRDRPSARSYQQSLADDHYEGELSDYEYEYREFTPDFWNRW